MNSAASGSGTRVAAWRGSIDGRPSLRRADRPGEGRAARSPYDGNTKPDRATIRVGDGRPAGELVLGPDPFPGSRRPMSRHGRRRGDGSEEGLSTTSSTNFST